MVVKAVEYDALLRKGVSGEEARQSERRLVELVGSINSVANVKCKAPGVSCWVAEHGRGRPRIRPHMDARGWASNRSASVGLPAAEQPAAFGAPPCGTGHAAAGHERSSLEIPR